MLCCSLCDNTLAANATPWWKAYSAIRSQTLREYFLQGPRFFISVSSFLVSLTRWLASAIAAERILEDSGPLGSVRPLSGCRYFRSAIVEVQAHGHHNYHAANFLSVQIFVGLFFVGVACPRKLVPHEISAFTVVIQLFAFAFSPWLYLCLHVQ